MIIAVMFGLIALMLLITGAVYFFKGQFAWGITLVIVALIIGPAGIWQFA